MTKTWTQIIENERQKQYFIELEAFLNKEYLENDIYPSRENLFNCFKLTALDKVKVVIIGQDPYHQKGQAHGLCFSVLSGTKMPPSLNNIFKELKADLNIDRNNATDLSNWAKQGVLLLNKVLSVRDSKPNSHQNKGWETFTDKIISEVNAKSNRVIFVLWGNNAQAAKRLISNKHHFIIESSHPSPLSAYHSFNGSKPFSKINNLLKNEGLSEIDWSL
ncbi:MAG: uracil-DNA glycosylase [Erysipelothrix sp.]|nr:uracil-DNA glycosylase [Erysipelothrix sp.]